MNKKRRGHNWKARLRAEVEIDEEAQKKIPLEFIECRQDECNALVLPSKKRKTIVRKSNASVVRLLSKKQRKFYEKILEKKKKKGKRALLVKELLAVQSPVDVLEKLTSITSVQTRGRKRISNSDVEDISNLREISFPPTSNGFNKIKTKKGNIQEVEFHKTRVYDPNIIGFESSDSETECESKGSRNEHVSENGIVAPDLKLNEIPGSLQTVNEVNDFKSKDIIDSTVFENSLKKMKLTNETRVSAEATIAFQPVRCPKLFIDVERDPLIERERLKLPIIGEEQRIMEAINENDIVIIAGETGCGKTTQLPQFLYEAGFAANGKMIGITEPRKIAAVSISQRVAQELNLSTKEVSYLVRFEGNSSHETRIKFMTDGVLMKELQNDARLERYSAIIIDEAHERSVFTDILIGLLTRIVPLRRKKFKNPLKLIIMSATLRLSDFTANKRLFGTTVPPVIQIDTRQFDVLVHFSKETPEDYMSAAFKKACKIHTKLPGGGMLIFVTGQQEVKWLVHKLRATFPASKEIRRTNRPEKRIKNNLLSNIIDENEQNADGSPSNGEEDNSLRVNLEDYAVKPTDEELELDEWADDIEDTTVQYERGAYRPLWALPLYALLPRAKQARVFEVPPNGYRLCVVATNVAETSLTIPNVKYVIDCGRTKNRVYDQFTSVSTYNTTWTSKASADQRAGRAGRTSEGHCYRLYSSAVYNEFIEWDEPDIKRKPVDDVVLMMKASGIDKVVQFPFPSPPDIENLMAAEKRLTLLGALEKPGADTRGQYSAKITPLGKSMAVYPVAPRFAKMLCMTKDRNLLSYMIAIVAALSIQQVLLPPTDDYLKHWRKLVGTGNSLLLGDVMVLLKALGGAEQVISVNGTIEDFCKVSGFRTKAILEARKLRVQLTNEINIQLPSLNLIIDPNMQPPTDAQAEQLRQMILAGMVDQIARKVGKEELKELELSSKKIVYRTADTDVNISLHTSSVLRKLKPEWIVFQEAFKSGDRYFARGITAVETDWLPLYASVLCNRLEPLKDPAPYFDERTGLVMCFLSGTFGRSGWQLPIMRAEYPANLERYKWFAKFLLDGYILPELKKYSNHLLGPTNWFFRTWGQNLSHKSDDILKALFEQKVDSLSKLTALWKTNPKFLLDAYLEWVPECLHEDIKSRWPPV